MKSLFATDIAEVHNQLKDENGDLAGKLIPINNWIIDEKEMENMIIELAENKEEYQLLKSRTVSASGKFNITNVVFKFLEIYGNC